MSFMRISDFIKICLYFVEGDDDEDAQVRWCGLSKLHYVAKELSKRLNAVEGILGKYVRITRSRNRRAPVKKYQAGARDDSAHGVRERVQILAFAQRLEEVDDCWCICYAGPA
ncbi:hypothetical protein Pogu_1123 [Pyrobaculum oguniense TE7]|uniref:Uncharacterized protein n=1 Tax=Pyrobaculum oguniense (strain DSM 13380 / JCM 10595 / TE7) TaxID=698757 RepID=H6QA28_PYROT|nr:hypothetical protein Pogu_1123 [Pyrobaculum oguniense TE7]